MRTLSRALAAVVFCVVSLAWSSPAEAQTVPFKVFITELWQLDQVDGPLGFIGDYFAKVTINGVEQSNKGACSDTLSTGLVTPFRLFQNFRAIDECGRTPWVFTAQVPAGQPVHVKIQLFDEDLVFDDEGDAKPGDGKAVELDVNPTSGLWSGDFAWPQTCSRPNHEGGGNNVNVCWQMGFDADDDGLLDVWERFGVDTDNDGVVDINLPALGANVLRKDIFLEVDHLQAVSHTHRPRQDAIDRVVKSFTNAPISNGDGTTGVQLHVDVGAIFGAGVIVSITGGGVTGQYGDLGGGNAIPEAGNEVIEAFKSPEAPAIKFADLKAANFNVLREYVFRYTIFAHQTNPRRQTNDCTSGQSSPTRRDFLVTLGGLRNKNNTTVPCWDTDIFGFSVGNSAQQGGTLMHELGHVLGLQHGGDADINHKPNYLSVMNYNWSFCEVPTSPALLPGLCDYSRLALGALPPDLDELDLDECVGIAGGLGFGAVDWNGNGVFEGASACGPVSTNVVADTNNDGVCVRLGSNKTLDTPIAGDDDFSSTTNSLNDGKNRVCNSAVPDGTDDQQVTAAGSTPGQPNPLKSFNDWDSLNLNLIDVPDGEGDDSAAEQEPDPETLEESRSYLSEMTAPAIAVDQTGPSSGKPGDVLTYTTKVKNTGKGPAVSSVLKETRPDGTVQTTEVGIITAGSEQTRSVNFTVPADACPGDFTGAAASLAFKDFAGQTFTVSDTTPLRILDVAAPSVDLTLAPSALWPPNHKFVVVNATITVKDNCDPNPVVTLVSIVSNEPATDAIGKGDDGPDVQAAEFGTDDRSFALRAERTTGLGSTGRSYTVTYRVTDTSGNSTVKTAVVTVATNYAGR